jgi:hypothetical protein
MNQHPTQLYESLVNVERLLLDHHLLSKTDEAALDDVLTRAVRKIAKQHPELKLASRWDLRHLAA